jgi:predicted GIY-YIG superfamily endonuclease
MAKTPETTSITIRCPSSLNNSIDEQATQTRQNKTDVIISMLLSSIPSLHITERAKLPTRPGIYFVYTQSHKLLYIGKADNLRTRWNSHHKYQYFIESSMECRIGYFTFDSIDQFEELKQQVEALQQQFNNTFSTLTQLGIDAIGN